MNDLYIPILLLNLTKQETKLLFSIYLIHEYENRKAVYTIEEIGNLVGMSKLIVEDILNKLMMKNIVGRIVYNSITDRTVRDNFDEEFLSTLYDKKNPVKSAQEKAGFHIDFLDRDYFLNPVIKSWKYTPKAKSVSTLKKLKKAIDNPFIDYMLLSFNFGKAGDRRKQSHAKLNGWNHKQIVEIFKNKYKIIYGNSYTTSGKDYMLMKKLLEQLSNGAMPKDNIEPFLQYAFEKARGQDYVLQIAGLRYHANEYLSNVVKNRT